MLFEFYICSISTHFSENVLFFVYWSALVVNIVVISFEANLFMGVVAKMAEQEDLELTSSHRHTKIATTYKAAIFKNNLRTVRKIFHI